MLVPLPPKSQTTTTPRDGRPGFARSARNAAVASGTSRVVGGRLVRSASTIDVGQCAGTVTATSETGSEPGSALVTASRASVSSASGRWVEPSEATSGTGSPMRSTKPLSQPP